MKFIITVDTEADNQWKSGGDISLTNILAVPRFQALCDTYDFPVTYLITHEVAASDKAFAILKPLQEGGRAEIGAHLHPWTTPPYFDEAQEHALMHFPSELTDLSLRDKFVVLHQQISKRYGAPTSFRAGRWGYDMRVGALLEEFGYIADCSVTPYINWGRSIKNGAGRMLPDFIDEDVFPHMRTKSVVEIPMTILPKDRAWVSRFGARVLNRGSFRVQWCRIFPQTTISELTSVYEKAKQHNLPYLEFMVHSSELVAGGSPYVKNSEALEHFYVVYEGFLKILSEQHTAGSTLTKAAEEFRKVEAVNN